MLGAVTFGHREFQPVIQAIIDLAETCAREPWSLPPTPPRTRRRSRRGCAKRSAPLIEAAVPRRKASRTAATGSMRPRRELAEAVPRRGAARDRAEAFQGYREGDRARRDLARRPAHRRPRHAQRPADILRGRHSAARARLGAVHPRRDAGAGRGDLGHRPGRADHRRARRRVSRKFHAALQFPALCHRRSRSAWARRGGARSATASSPGARSGRCCPTRRAFPTRSASSRRSPNRTARRRWPRCAAPRWR